MQDIRTNSQAAGNRRPVLLAVASLLMIAFSFAVLQAQTRVDADFQRYCREKVPNSTYEMRAEKWGVVHYCNQGGTLQNIDLAEACRLTTGSPDHQQDGQRVYCTGHGPMPEAPSESTALDLQRYCRETFPNSEYERRAESWGIAHYCRLPGETGGFALQTIDLAKACRAQYGRPNYQQVGDRVFCNAGDSTGADRGSYTWPKTGFVFHGPIEDGKPNGIGWTRIPPTEAIWVGRYRDGLPVGPQLESRKGQLRCFSSNLQKMESLPMSQCARLRQHLPKAQQ